MSNNNNEEDKIKILGGFFVYRAKPTSESKRIQTLLSSQTSAGSESEDQFAQQGEITGMVLIKQSGKRTFMTYAPIDPKEYTVDKFMEYFKDTIANNEYDNSTEKVFDIEALGTLVNKLIIQTIEEEPSAEALISETPDETPGETPDVTTEETVRPLDK